jgi:hypothetical protein
MLIRQEKKTENLAEINKEINKFYSNYEVSFNKSYISYDGKNEWVDPTTTKRVFDNILENITYTETDTLIDCGSGLGHVLYLSSFKFNKVIGIEILEDICRESKRNLISLMGDEVFYKKITLISGNVLEQESAFFDKGSIFYISSPFSNKNDFRLLVEKICDSIKRINRKVYLIYYYPYFENVLDDYCDYFKFLKKLNLIGDVVIYEHKQ